MCSGSEFKKYGRRGKPATRNVILNRAQTHIVYNSSKKNVQDAAISVPEIVCVKTGIDAGNFLRFTQLSKKGDIKSLCITIVYARPDPNISNKLKRLNELIDPSSGKEEQIHYRAEWIALKAAERSYQRNPANQMTLDLCAASIYQQNVWLTGLRELILQQKVKDDTRIEELRAREGSPAASFVPPPYISPALQPHPIPMQQQRQLEQQHFSPLPPAVSEEDHASSAAAVHSPPMQLPVGYEPPGGPLLMYEPGGMPPPNSAVIMMGEAEDADIDAEGNLVDHSAARAASSSSHSPQAIESASAASSSAAAMATSPPPLPVSPRPSMAAFQVLIPDAQARNSSPAIEESPGQAHHKHQQRSANPSPFVGPGATPLPGVSAASASSSSSMHQHHHHQPLQAPPPSALVIPLYPSLEQAQPSPGPVPNASIVMMPAISDTPMHANASAASSSAARPNQVPAERPSIKVVTPVVELPDDINTLMHMACAAKLNGVANWDINLKIVGIVSSYNKNQLKALFAYPNSTLSQLLRSNVHSTALLALILFESLYENCPNVRSVKMIQNDPNWMKIHLLKMIPRWSRKPRSPVSWWKNLFTSPAEKQHNELLRGEQKLRIPMLRWSKTKIIIASIANERASGIHWFAAFNKMKQAGAYDNLNRDIQVALDQAVALQVVNEQQRPVQAQPQQQQQQQQQQMQQQPQVRSPQEAKQQEHIPNAAMPLKPIPGMLDTNLANFNQHLSMLSSSMSSLSDAMHAPSFQSDVFQQQQAKYQFETLERTHAQLKRDLAQVTSGSKPGWLGEEQIAQMFNMSEFLHESEERYKRRMAAVTAAASASSSSSSYAPVAPLSASSLREHKESEEKQQQQRAPALAVSGSFLLSPPRATEHVDSPHAVVPAVAISSAHLSANPSSQRNSFTMEQDEKQSSSGLLNVSRPLGIVASAPTATPALMEQYLAQAAAERLAAQQQQSAEEVHEHYSVISPASVGESEVVSPPDYLHVPRIHRASASSSQHNAVEEVEAPVVIEQQQEAEASVDVEHAPHAVAEPAQEAAAAVEPSSEPVEPVVVAAEEDELKLVAQDKKKEKKKKKKQAAASQRAVVLM